MLWWHRRERWGVKNLGKLGLGNKHPSCPVILLQSTGLFQQKYKSARSKLLHVIKEMPEKQRQWGGMASFHLHSFDIDSLQLK